MAKYPNPTLQDERTLLNACIMAYGDLTNRKTVQIIKSWIIHHYHYRLSLISRPQN